MTETDSSSPELIGFAHQTVRDLRHRLASTSDGAAALRDAGYAGADSVYSAFATWVTENGGGAIDEMTLDQFSSRAAEFFRAAGWGKVSIRSLHDALAVVDIEDCWEASGVGAGSGCHLTTGTLAGFLGQLTDFTVAAMEIECGSGTGGRCRFLAGTAEMLDHAYERVVRGEEWETIGAGDL